MCGRFTLRAPSERLAQHFGLEEPPELDARYNVAPGQDVVTIRVAPGAGARSSEPRRWGLVPRWAKDPAIGSRLINARAETVAEKPAYREALRLRRCLIPADGFYEWGAGPGAKQPWLIERPDGALFAFAGLWDHWEAGDGRALDSCTIVTSDANDALRAIHPRMPVILEPADYDRWLDPDCRDPERLAPLLLPCPDDRLVRHAVGTRVNDVGHDDAGCIERVPEPLSLF